MATNKPSAAKSVTNQPKRRRITLSFYSPEARNVALVGDFNNWDHTKSMKKDKDGKWIARLELEPGKYEYRYLVDGEWQNDPQCQSFTQNQFGTQNCILEVSN